MIPVVMRLSTLWFVLSAMAFTGKGAQESEVHDPGCYAPFYIVVCALGDGIGMGIERTNPIPVKTPQPDYPDDLQDEAIHGRAVIRMTVDENGRVETSEVHSATHDAFGVAALEAAKQWEFEPATRSGEAVAVTIDIPFRFSVPLREKLAMLNERFGRKVFVDFAEKDVIPIRQLGRRLRPKRMLRPVYPDSLKGSGIEGVALIGFVIDKKGKVVNPRVIRSDHKAFNSGAILTSLSLEFDPVKVKRKPVCVEMRVPFRFSENPQAQGPRGRGSGGGQGGGFGGR